MPRVTLETKVEVAHNIYEIQSKTYELPLSIMHNNEICYFDSYHQGYLSKDGKMFITAKDYVEKVLANKQKTDKDDGIQK